MRLLGAIIVDWGEDLFLNVFYFMGIFFSFKEEEVFFL